ncbi:hypothetical protein [Gimesia algae]|uniref:Uncharacterized protein n=1 Tax=Gimesia algae TaxID=2527971 RepID=A0A517V9U7_9PLAN|nr:hypothetical protein [Gimesia algae]QDT89773.1 hypothetical protein Pan161_14050 [Gimesia algae]
MKQSKQNLYRLENEMTRGKLSLLRGLSPLFFTGVIGAGGVGLLLLRAVALIQVEDSYLPVLTVGALMSSLVAGNLLLLRQFRLLRLSNSHKSGLTLALVLPVLSGMLAVLPENGLNLMGILFFCLTYFMAFAGVLEWLDREAAELAENDRFNDPHQGLPAADSAESCSDAAESQISGLTEIDADREKRFEALLTENQSDIETHSDDEEHSHCSQWMNRNSDESGFECIEGGVLVQFEPQQKTRVVHLGLYPPLKGKLSVNCEFDPGLPVRTRILETRGYGVSVEVKRSADLEQEFQAVMQYWVTNQALNEDVA